MEAYNTVNKIDIICLSESFLDSSILTENNNLKINGYEMMQKKEVYELILGNLCHFVILVIHI